MYEILKTSANGRCDFSLCDTSSESSNSDPHDPWLFTDPDAREAYAQQNRLDQLESDVLAYAMYEGCWAPDELELKHALERLLHDSTLVPKGTFGHLSPHPTVYRATHEGTLEVAGHKFHFAAGNDVILIPWLVRVSHPGLFGPVWIGKLQTATQCRLCCEAFPNATILCEKALAVLRQTLPRRKPGHFQFTSKRPPKI